MLRVSAAGSHLPPTAAAFTPAKRLKLSVILPRGIHPFPSRTRKLSPAGPMVLHAPSVWERRSLPALIKASLRNQIGLFLLPLLLDGQTGLNTGASIVYP